MNRRTILKGGLVLAATGHTAASAPAVGHSLESLIERHRFAWQMFEDSCDRADALSENYDPAYVEVNDRFNAEEEVSLVDIAAFRTSTREEEVLKASYLLRQTGHTYDQDSCLFRTMLKSMISDGKAGMV